MDAVRDNIISYNEMCRREGISLQQGMNYGLGGNHSVILMSLRPNAPYRDCLEDSGITLVYEGHDIPRNTLFPNPKIVDQPLKYPSGGLTQNGKFTPLPKLQNSASVIPSESESLRKNASRYLVIQRGFPSR